MKQLTLSEELLYSTTRITSLYNIGGSSTGTGFFYDIEVKDKFMPVIVTNKHVIEGADLIKVKFTEADTNGDPNNTRHFDWEINNISSLVILHPTVDLCIIPILPAIKSAEAAGKTLFFRTIDNSLIPSQEVLERQLTAIEEITMIGYPNGLWDSVNNLPIVRRGITATHPNLNYNGKAEIVIDAACFPGSSGSPVFIFNENGFSDRNGNTYVGGNRILLLGILYAGPQITTTGEIVVRDIPTDARPMAVTNLMMNLGYVIKSKKLNDFVSILANRI